jgi:PAN domain
MLKAGKIGIWVTVAGIALMLQGCWDEQPQQLALLGDGGCRMANGAEGKPTLSGAKSPDECQAQCFTGETPCVAVEYNANNNRCEVHHDEITKFEKVAGVTCYVVR